MLTSPSFRFSAGRGLAAVAAAAFVAAVFVQVDAAPRAASPAGVAGEAMMRLLGEEHAAIAGSVEQQVAALTRADQTAARDFEKMKVAALQETEREAKPSLRLAQAATPAREEKAKPSIVRVAAKSEPVRAMTGAAVTGEPIQLTAMTDMEAMQAPRPPGLVRGPMREAAAPVERRRSWFSAAAGWVAETVPMPRMSLPQLPMRHFRV